MAVIDPPTGSHLHKWNAIVSIGVALTVPPIMAYMVPNLVSQGPEMIANLKLASAGSEISIVSESNQNTFHSDASTVYEIPQNLGLPNRREPGGTR